MDKKLCPYANRLCTKHEDCNLKYDRSSTFDIYYKSAVAIRDCMFKGKMLTAQERLELWH